MTRCQWCTIDGRDGCPAHVDRWKTWAWFAAAVCCLIVASWIVWLAMQAASPTTAASSVTVTAAVSPVDVFDRAERHPSRGIPRAVLPPTVAPTTSTTRPTPTGSDLGVFETTCYGPPDFPAGQHTSSGQPVGPGSVAADPAVIPRGTRLHVDGWGDGIVNDTGGAIHGRRLDLWGPSHAFCVQWGRRHVRVTKTR